MQPWEQQPCERGRKRGNIRNSIIIMTIYPASGAEWQEGERAFIS